jgi:SOS response regulatory protein OraA/RecX
MVTKSLGRCSEEHAQAARVQKEKELNGPATSTGPKQKKIARQLAGRGFSPDQVATILAVIEPHFK